MKRVLLLLCIAALLAGCTQPGNKPATDPDATAATVPLITEEEMFTDRDRAGTYKDAVEVDLSAGSYTVSQPGTYLLRGALTEGSIIVKAGDTDKVQLVLAGVEISCSTNAPICILSGDKVFITLAEGTTNTLTGPAEAVTVGEYNINAALYSRSDLAINGTGSLTIHAPGGHGISCKDDLVITGGTVNITAAGHGLDANDSVRIGGGTVTADAGKDGIHAENTEDATKGFVYISGGDAVDSNGNMTMTGGYVYATNYRTGDVSVLDSQNRPVITGGTYIGLGMSTMMAESFSEESGQGVIACTCGDQPAGSVLTIKDSKGNTLLELESEYNTAIMIISSPQIEKGQSYTVSIGTVSGTIKAD